MESATDNRSGAGQPNSEQEKRQENAQESKQQGQQLQGSAQQGGAAVQQRTNTGVARYGTNPLSTMRQLSDELDQLFESFFYPLSARGQRRQERAPALWVPEVEVTQQGNELRIRVDLPGVSKENINVEIHEQIVVIQGERREERTEEDQRGGARIMERRYGTFYRAIPLPDGAEAEKAEARMKDGVLEITIPVSEDSSPRKVEIKG
jgi:HSP20 family protein